jgi:hypothetical protein
MIEMSSVHRVGLSVILFDNLNDSMGFVIGRADKRYTLWRYNKVGNPDNDRVSLNLEYVQVLSPDRYKVEKRFPDVFICEELRGEKKMTLTRGGRKTKSRPASAPKSIYDFTEMPFGQFRGVNFSDMIDWRLVKLANHIIDYDGDYKWTDAWGVEFDFEELIMGKLNECGCRMVGGRWYTPAQLENPKLWMYLANTNRDKTKQAEYDEMCQNFDCIQLMGKWFTCTPAADQKPWQVLARQILPLIEEGLPFSFVAPYNSNGFFAGVRIEFRPEDKEDVYTYYGSSHFLKVTNKKGVKVNKRVKGKTIEVLEYEVISLEDIEPYILVNKFNIL